MTVCLPLCGGAIPGKRTTQQHLAAQTSGNTFAAGPATSSVPTT
jgi:hypothetical protein